MRDATSVSSLSPRVVGGSYVGFGGVAVNREPVDLELSLDFMGADAASLPAVPQHTTRIRFQSPRQLPRDDAGLLTLGKPLTSSVDQTRS